MRKREGQMKVKNLILKKRKKCANESSESRTKRLTTQSQYQKQKKIIANELADCREKRLFNNVNIRQKTE